MANLLTTVEAQSANLSLMEVPRKGSQSVHDVVTAMRANRRSGTANTKTRADLHKPDKKPWRQKGTGRARAGTVNSPIFCGGAVIFGPKPRSYAKKVNKATRKVALRAALSSRIAAGDVFSLTSFTIADGKTKSFVNALKAVTDKDKVLVISAAFDEKTYLAGRNHGKSLLVTALDVNVEQLVDYHKIIITSDALPVLAQRTA